MEKNNKSLSKDMCFIDATILEHKNKFIKEIQSDPTKVKRLLGQNGVWLLQRLLARSLALCDLFKASATGKNILGLALATRAHLETTALLTCLNKKFSNFYSEECTQEELEDFLKKALLGVKSPTTIDIDPSLLPTPINVLTLVQKTDKIIQELGISKKAFFLEKYESLSELCHPNFHGTALDAQVFSKEGRVVFRHYSDSFVENECGIYPIFKVSASVFFNSYNRLFKQLTENEEMPEFIR